MNRDQVVCHCRQITYGMLVDAVALGYDDYQKLFEALRFGVGCGGCRVKIRQMLYQLKIEARNARKEA